MGGTDCVVVRNIILTHTQTIGTLYIAVGLGNGAHIFIVEIIFGYTRTGGGAADLGRVAASQHIGATLRTTHAHSGGAEEWKVQRASDGGAEIE